MDSQEIIKIVATRCHILNIKCTEFDFGCDSTPDLTAGAYSALPDIIAGFQGPTSKGREGGQGNGSEQVPQCKKYDPPVIRWLHGYRPAVTQDE